MVLDCKHVWREISNYIDGDLDPSVRASMEKHLAHCRHCAAILDSTRNIVYLIADERTFALPIGFSERLRARLESELEKSEPASPITALQFVVKERMREKFPCDQK